MQTTSREFRVLAATQILLANSKFSNFKGFQSEYPCRPLFMTSGTSMSAFSVRSQRCFL